MAWTPAYSIGQRVYVAIRHDDGLVGFYLGVITRIDSSRRLYYFVGKDWQGWVDDTDINA